MESSTKIREKNVIHPELDALALVRSILSKVISVKESHQFVGCVETVK
jgi:hypothetical protein